MGRIVEVLVGISALAGIATFLGVRTAVRQHPQNTRAQARGSTPRK